MVMQIRPRDLPQWLEQAAKWADPWYLTCTEPFERQRAQVRADRFRAALFPWGNCHRACRN